MAEPPHSNLDFLHDALADPIRKALATTQKHLGVHAGAAHKHRADVAPFASLDVNTTAALQDLHALMVPGEYTYIFGVEPPAFPGFDCKGPAGVTQFLFPPDASFPDLPPGPELTCLSCADGPAMVALTDAAFPGFFRARTCEMGNYYGVRDGGRLVAMGGERLVFGRYREISGVCTLPGQRGRGLATRIIGQLLRDHRHNGDVSWLYATSTNTNAIALYLHLGFLRVREVPSFRLLRLE